MNRPPSVLRAAALLAARDLRVEWRRPESLPTAAMFAMTVALLVRFSADGDQTTPAEAAGTVWIVLAFSALVSMARGFSAERRNDALSALLAAPIDRTAIYLGKLAGNLVQLAVLSALAAGWVALTGGVRADPLVLVGSLALFGFGLAILGTAFSAITARLGRGETLLATLTLPAAAPLVLGGLRTTQQAYDRTVDAGSWWLLGGAFALLYLSLAIITFEIVMED